MDRKHMQEVINGMRNIVKPYLAKQLKKINFEGCGNTDKAEFETDFEIVLTLAEQALAIPSAHKTCEGCVFTRGCCSCQLCSRFYTDMYIKRDYEHG